jgi:hypothetical protein
MARSQLEASLFHALAGRFEQSEGAGVVMSSSTANGANNQSWAAPYWLLSYRLPGQIL